MHHRAPSLWVVSEFVELHVAVKGSLENRGARPGHQCITLRVGGMLRASLGKG